MYIILELQTHEDGQVGSLIWSFAERSDAEMQYHTALASAAKSGLPCHGVVMLNNRGNQIKSQVYLNEEALINGVEE